MLQDAKGYNRVKVNKMDAYQEALDYLYSHIDYSLQRVFRMSPERFDLERVRALLAALGDPQQAYPIIHIAGTKGKGSVAAFCASALQAAGYRVGLYSSPHLIEYTERIRVNFEEIPKAALVVWLEKYKPIIAKIPLLTTFEITTAMAYSYFAQEAVDVAVVEVGLGGRLDATNVIRPIVSIITSLSYDHAEILGDTLGKIAAEKAGIIKDGVAVVMAPQKEEARRVVMKIAAERDAPLIEVGRDWLFAPHSHALEGQRMFVWSSSEQALVNAYIESGGAKPWQPTRLYLALLGYHQVQNAATAYAALQMVREHAIPLSEAAIKDGFSQVKWSARFEVLHRYPPLIIDAAHNRDSAQKLSMAIGGYFPGLPLVLLFGASEDKDVDGMFAELMPRVRQVVATCSTHPRAMQPSRLVDLAHKYGRPAKAIVSLESALEEALRIAAGEAVVLASGSVFLAAGVRQAWLKGVNNG